MSKKRIKIIAACTVAMSMATVACNLAYAHDDAAETKTFAFDEVVVTATRTPQTVFDANATVNVITREDIEQMHYKTIEEALRTVPNIQFLNYGIPGYQLNKVRINGSEHIVVLVDGVRADNPGSGALFPLHLLSNMDNIERIEVMRGGSATTYGSEAKGGVINIITRKAKNIKRKWMFLPADLDRKINCLLQKALIRILVIEFIRMKVIQAQQKMVPA